MATIKDIAKMHKTFIYDTYIKLLGLNYLDEEYDKLTRKKMINEIYDLYKNDYKIIYYALNDHDLNTIKLIYDKKYTLEKAIKDDYSNHYHDLLIVDILSFSIVDEIKDTIKIALDEYKNNKEEIEKKKERYYLIVGLIRSYGILTYDELKLLFNKYFNESIDEYINSYYVLLNTYEKDNKYYLSENLENYDYDILKTHSKEFKTLYDYECLITRGKYFYDINSDAYKLIKNSSIYSLIRIYGEEISIYKGFDNIEAFLNNNSNILQLHINNEKEFEILINYTDSLPVFLLNDYSNRNVSKDVADLFYSFSIDLIKFAAKKLKLQLRINNLGMVEPNDSFNVYKELIQNVEIIDEYISSNNLNEKQIEMLEGIKKAKYGMFFAYKDLNNGTIFIDESEDLYLVKGLLTPIKKLINNYPSLIENIIFPYKDYIITNGLVIKQQVKFGKNICKHLNDVYNKKKHKIIKTF